MNTGTGTGTGVNTGGTVNVPTPAGPSGKTFFPLKGTKFPNAVGFLDPDYHAGYPVGGRPSNPGLVGYWHTGVDFNGPGACNADQGDSVHAVRDGVIEYAGDGGGSWGPIIVQRVTVDGFTYWIRYAHVQAHLKSGSSIMCRAGATVKAGDVLAGVGRGNPAHPWPCAHLHFDVFYKRPLSWGWWPTRGGSTAQVTALLTDPMAWLQRLGAVSL